jgi:intermediate peptidase
MARTPGMARSLLEKLSTGLHLKAREEAALLRSLKQQLEGATVEGATAEDLDEDGDRVVALQAWDKMFYTAEARRRVLGQPGGGGDMREYLPLSRVVRGIGELLEQVFGVVVTPQPLAAREGWAPNVEKLKLTSRGAPAAGGGGGVAEGAVELGTLFLDLWARGGKPYGAAHYTIQCGRELPGGSYRAPVVALSCNLQADARAGEPLLSHDELETLLHEFGHVLHSVLGRTRYQHLSGTRAVADVVEVPSTLMENFAYEPSVLTNIARHYRTGEPVPAAMLAALAARRRLFAATDTLQQLVYGLVDLQLHAHAPCDSDGAGWSSAIAEAAARVARPCIPAPQGCYWYADLTHLGSYGANYYRFRV